MSQHNNLPFCHGMRVRPPGRSSSVRNNPTGSLVTGTPAEEKPRATKSFRAWCLADWPAGSSCKWDCESTGVNLRTAMALMRDTIGASQPLHHGSGTICQPGFASPTTTSENVVGSWSRFCLIDTAAHSDYCSYAPVIYSYSLTHKDSIPVWGALRLIPPRRRADDHETRGDGQSDKPVWGEEGVTRNDAQLCVEFRLAFTSPCPAALLADSRMVVWWARRLEHHQTVLTSLTSGK